MPNPPGGLNKPVAGVKMKWWVIGGGLTAAGAYLYYRHMASSSTAATTDPNATDPAAEAANATTGDPNALANGYDVGSSDLGSFGYGGYSGAYDGLGGSGGLEDPWELLAIEQQQQLIPSTNTTTTTKHTERTNRTWMHEAIKWLEQHGTTKAAATAAVSAYLAGAPMTDKQIHLVESAIGGVGQPPHSVPTVHRVHTPKQPAKPPVKHRKPPVHHRHHN